MDRLTGTTPDEVLLSVKRRLIDVIADGTDSSVYLSSVSSELPPNAADFMYEVAFEGGSFGDAEMAGGGTSTLHVVGSVVVSIHSTVQIDETGRDDSYLASRELGILPRATSVLDALAVHELENELGEWILSEPMRPVDTQVPSHTDRRRGFASVGFSVEFDWDIGVLSDETTGDRLTSSTPDVILESIQCRIANCVAGANDSNVYLSTVPDSLPPNSGEFVYEVYLSRGVFDQDEIAGGGRNAMHCNSDIHITIHSANQMDETGRDETFLTDPDRGVIPKATNVLNALAIHDLEDSLGQRILAHPMRPTSFVIPPKEDRRKGFMQLTFAAAFDWGVSPSTSPKGVPDNTLELFLFDAGDVVNKKNFYLLEDGVNEIQTE